MQAIILAAGMGKRLKELTKDVTKCMIKVNGVTLIERLLSYLESFNLSRIIIVVGYKSEKLMSFISTLKINTPIVYVNNDIYDKTNNIYSLFLAKEYLKEEDTLLFESDLIFEKAVLEKLLSNPFPNLALVAKHENWMDGTVVTINEENKILDFIDKKHFLFSDLNKYYKTVNIYKFSKEFSKDYYIPMLNSYISLTGQNEYYEQILRIIILLNKADILKNAVIKAEIIDTENWYEIDDQADLNIAESLFPRSSKERLSLYQKRYGGYWRYPNLLDFCYLVNPYYPPYQLIDEIKSNLKSLISDYPSGLEINCLLAGKYFGIRKEHIIVGNGASELIKELMDMCSGKIGVIVPTFEEYANRKKTNDVITFLPEKNNFRYCADDIISYYSGKEISSLLLINPDNPSGNYLSHDDVILLSDWTKINNIRLIIDESFIDFADSGLMDTMLTEENLMKYPNLVIVKSISKSFGVAGLRLGILVTSDKNVMDALKNNVSIWNINSIAEFYLQICEKYHDDYLSALSRFRAERDEFTSNLKKIDGIRVFPTQANFVMCEITDKSITSTKLTEHLLEKESILIKDLKGKRGIDGDYVRLAVRNKTDNQKLLMALKNILSNSGQ